MLKEEESRLLSRVSSRSPQLADETIRGDNLSQDTYAIVECMLHDKSRQFTTAIARYVSAVLLWDSYRCKVKGDLTTADAVVPMACAAYIPA